MPYVRVPTGTKIYFERVGTGPPLLLIMGTGLDHSFWDVQVEDYRHEFECITFDTRGTGRTEPGGGRMTTRLLAEEAAALMDQLSIRRAHVSGLSLGSCIAQELTLLRPELVQTLQLHGTWGRAHGYAARKFRAQLRLLDTLEMRAFYEINVLWFLTPEFMARRPQEVVARIDAAVKTNPSRELLKEQYRADLEHDALDRLGRIRAPTLVTVGTFDLAAPPLYAREVVDRVPGAELVTFGGGGHLHNVENPAEFNRVTLNFLRRHLR